MIELIKTPARRRMPSDRNNIMFNNLGCLSFKIPDGFHSLIKFLHIGLLLLHTVMNVLKVSDLTMSNGLTTSKSSLFELTENSSSIGNTSGRDSLSLLMASARLSDIPEWNSMPGRNLFALGQTVNVRSPSIKFILTFRKTFILFSL